MNYLITTTEIYVRMLDSSTYGRLIKHHQKLMYDSMIRQILYIYGITLFQLTFTSYERLKMFNFENFSTSFPVISQQNPTGCLKSVYWKPQIFCQKVFLVNFCVRKDRPNIGCPKNSPFCKILLFFIPFLLKSFGGNIKNNPWL